MSNPTFRELMHVNFEPYSGDELLDQLRTRANEPRDMRLYATVCFLMHAVAELDDRVIALANRLDVLQALSGETVETGAVTEDRLVALEAGRGHRGDEHCAAIHSAAITSVTSLAAITSELDRRVSVVEKEQHDRSATAQALGKRGGEARAIALSAEQRSDLARRAVKARWAKQVKAAV